MDAKRAGFTTGSGIHDKPNRRGVLRAMFIALAVSLAVLSAAYFSGALSLQEAEAASMQETERALESFAGLDDRIAEAESLGEDDVEDAECIMRLQSALDTAQVVRNLSPSDVEVLPAIADSIDAAREEVERSNAEWSAAQARSRAGSSYGGGYSTGTGDGAWNVSYRGTDDSSTANADGSVSEWRDGYYIAHNWSYGGGQIASKPGTVVVNGRTYRYVSSMVVPRSTTWDEVSGFVYANNGIGFQTCYGDGYLITHYEPM